MKAEIEIAKDIPLHGLVQIMRTSCDEYLKNQTDGNLFVVASIGASLMAKILMHKTGRTAEQVQAELDETKEMRAIIDEVKKL